MSRYYKKRIAEAEAELKRAKRFESRLQKIADARYEMGLRDEGKYLEKSDVIWDKCYKAVRAAENKLRDAKQAYNRRNWDCQDYYRASLIAQNID